MKTAILILSLVFAALNASWFYHQRLWSRGISVLFWLVLAMSMMQRQPWQLPTMIALILVRLGFTVYERRTGKAQDSIEKIIAKQQEEREWPGDAASGLATKGETFRAAPDPIEVRFVLEEPRELTATDGEMIALAAGEHHWQIRLEPDLADEEEPYHRKVRFRVQGTSPEGTRSFEYARELALMIDLPACGIGGRRQLVPWSEAPDAVRETFRARCILADCVSGDDQRIRFTFQVGGKDYQIMTKYLEWRTDLAVDADGRRLWVRISDLMPEEQGNEPADIVVPPFYFELPVAALLQDDDDVEMDEV